ncbi:Type II secretion system (T2SS), protein M [Oceanospirillum multiglobuliferum]|uniref:Type II secretion system protein M n=1 Tax=Oceanospirillum multiglobuliferum TaxID=64969 RepID=A0A1T4SBU3_9GAMM|nr:type II secretion system protein GspM [Oceanospirillum multiglobuliferum]OPX55034.1 hypothetical protein BTE48_11185 [Oceanospirillum multiglobuliferum]SKA25714.1 Type II secretion system (T2SS), protein M [Oceanospirillum multiglobuliferum]
MSRLLKFQPLANGAISKLLSNLIPVPLHHWWQQQSGRDQSALKLLGWLLVFVLFYLLLWQPITQSAEQKATQQAKQFQRQEQALLRYYERLNQYGSADFSPFDDWLKTQLSRYQISLIQQQKSNNPTNATAKKQADAKLVIRYQQQKQASDFLIAADKRIALIDLQVDQIKREISFRYYERF